MLPLQDTKDFFYIEKSITDWSETLGVKDISDSIDCQTLTKNDQIVLFILSDILQIDVL